MEYPDSIYIDVWEGFTKIIPGISVGKVLARFDKSDHAEALHVLNKYLKQDFKDRKIIDIGFGANRKLYLKESSNDIASRMKEIKHIQRAILVVEQNPGIPLRDAIKKFKKSYRSTIYNAFRSIRQLPLHCRHILQVRSQTGTYEPKGRFPEFRLYPNTDEYQHILQKIAADFSTNCENTDEAESSHLAIQTPPSHNIIINTDQIKTDSIPQDVPSLSAEGKILDATHSSAQNEVMAMSPGINTKDTQNSDTHPAQHTSTAACEVHNHTVENSKDDNIFII